MQLVPDHCQLFCSELYRVSQNSLLVLSPARESAKATRTMCDTMIAIQRTLLLTVIISREDCNGHG